MITESELLDSLAESLKANYMQEGEYTVAIYSEEMKKRGVEINWETSKRILEKLVKGGKWTVRDGCATNGKNARLYKPIMI